jgi:RNA polymerase sigma-70 factor (ECF subfamily)
MTFSEKGFREGLTVGGSAASTGREAPCEDGGPKPREVGVTAAVETFASAAPRTMSEAVPQDSEDVALVLALREGDRMAFEAVYRRYAPVAHGILLARVPRSEVEDLVQEVFLLVFRRIRSLRDPRAFPGWLAMITRNRAVDYHRRAPRTEELKEEPGGDDAPESGAAAVLDTIRRLPEAYREPLILRLVEGMTGPEIAERTGLTPGSVRVNLHRGMEKLREELRRRGFHG